MHDFTTMDRMDKMNRMDRLEKTEKMDRKLQLVQQIRSRYHENQYDMSNRERILYGRSSVFDKPDYDEDALPDSDDGSLSSFKLRFFIALVLFGIVVFMDRSHIAIGGITPEKLYGMISADYEEKIEDWVEAMSNSTQN